MQVELPALTFYPALMDGAGKYVRYLPSANIRKLGKVSRSKGERSDITRAGSPNIATARPAHCDTTGATSPAPSPSRPCRYSER